MRPSETVSETGVYECYGCGRRETDPDGRACPVCGSELRNIGRPRDL